ncbi:isocitrate lyase/PEP mutase family protein [Saccharolobus caldissimus]|uniref:Methylisocitrate lyase n=1 Tax=Saccharolobus caldissimus TaxID=1702097 RepID=A0AAQ4CUF0_9CREN|nr:isocitrate lyase/PEP mutase family protein [Saccharolobus caldissimus]BDB99431.1 methylisocitrate lyase [Saccharolobus caldissimus]
MNYDYISFINRIRRKPILIAPGAYDALSARLIEHIGFEAIYIGGASASYSLLGMPDLGFITFDRMSDHISRIRQVTSLPLICDADTGYGNEDNIRYVVKTYEKIGCIAIQIEDQVWPKKCGHLSNKEVTHVKEMVLRIKAALSARKEAIIIARTDAIDPLGINEAIERANIYLEEGADVAFIEAPRNINEIERISKEVKGLKMINMVEGGITPLLSAKKLEEMGFSIVIYPGSAIRAAAKAVITMLSILKDTGSTKDFIENMVQFNDLQKFLYKP